MKRFSRFFRHIAIASATTLIAACAGQPRTATRLTAGNYLQLAQQAQGIQQQQYQLKAIDIYLAKNNIILANKLINTVAKETLDPSLIIQAQLQQINLDLLKKLPNKALDRLRSLGDPTLLSPQDEIRYYTLFADTYLATGHVIDSVNMRMTLNSHLDTTAEKKENLWKIWRDLQTLGITTLESDSVQTPSDELHAWLTLVILTKEYGNQPEALLSKLKQWRTTYPDHPANILLPQKLPAKHVTEKAKNIALLVPLSGRYKKYGDAIRNGFFTAYYTLKKHDSTPPIIHIFNTDHKNITTLYQKAVTAGADFIVGPLQKSNLQALVNNKTFSVPTLSLNTISNGEKPLSPALYEFGLSPEDEAIQAAQKAWGTHHQRVIIIAKDNAWSKTVANAFTTQWQALGGKIIATQWVKKPSTFSTDMRDLLGISKAYQDKHRIHSILRERMRFIPRRRQDFDSIFLVASSQDARQILPLLRFYFANDIPVFSTSQLYKHAGNTSINRDLNGVFFCDTPWMLQKSTLEKTPLNEMKARIQMLWPKQYDLHPRFYALGVDAFNITQKLSKMLILSDLGIPAATGTLSLLPNHHIYRQLPWAVFRKGKPEIVN